MILHALNIFLSSFLLFQVQLMVGKMILPWFGGSSAVWSTVMLFFQGVLCGGYAYAYWLAQKKNVRTQRIIHPLLLGSSLILLGISAWLGGAPLIPGSNLHPVNPGFPVWEITKLLALLVGLPGFLLAANSVITQDSFNRSSPSKDPYFLYAISNTGSLLALISYPIFFEPEFSLSSQAWIWAVLYLIFTICSAAQSIRTPQRESIQPPGPAPSETGHKSAPASLQDGLLWIGFSATGAILLFSTTSQLTQEVAPVPLLWVLPLGLYLISFILVFGGMKFYRRSWAVLLLTLSSAGVLVDVLHPGFSFFLRMAIYLSFMFGACLIAHGELFQLRPPPAQLSRFYLLVSAGGALGGAAVTLLAPLIFNWYWEFYLGWTLILGLLLTQLIPHLREKKGRVRWKDARRDILQLAVSLTLLLATALVLPRDPLYGERNFYGVSEVVYSDYRDAYQYVNGQTVHGFQPRSPQQRDLPTAYFWRGSGIAIMLLNHPSYGQGMKVGVLGLGIGTLAAYGQPGDSYIFYEIDPLVVELAQGKGGYFSYLADSKAEIQILPGDARLSLERQLERGQIQEFDLLVMDAFSSDSVPIHLVTREAFKLYLEHLAPDGVIAVNISNNYIDLQPVIWTLARELGLTPILIDPPVQAYHPLAAASRWMFLVRNPALLEPTEIRANADFLDDYSTQLRPWSDDYSNLFQILR